MPPTRGERGPQDEASTDLAYVLSLARELTGLAFLVAGVALLVVAAWIHDSLLGIAALGTALVAAGFVMTTVDEPEAPAVPQPRLPDPGRRPRA